MVVEKVTTSMKAIVINMRHLGLTKLGNYANNELNAN